MDVGGPELTGKRIGSRKNFCSVRYSLGVKLQGQKKPLLETEIPIKNHPVKETTKLYSKPTTTTKVCKGPQKQVVGSMTAGVALDAGVHEAGDQLSISYGLENKSTYPCGSDLKITVTEEVQWIAWEYAGIRGSKQE